MSYSKIDISKWYDIGVKLEKIYVRHQCKGNFPGCKYILENMSVSLINLLMSQPRKVHRNAILLYEKLVLLYGQKSYYCQTIGW